MNSASPRLLIVEDDEDLSMVLSLILQDAGYCTSESPNGADALLKLEQEQVDLILLDMSMPVMNGWEFSGQLHRRYGRNIPVIVVTAAESARKWAEEVSADDFVPKPFDLEYLLGCIRAVLASRGRRAAPSNGHRPA